MVYLVCFAASVFLAYLANKADCRKKFILFSVLSIILPVILAGLRDFNVGIDTMNYFTKYRYWYGAMAADSFWDYLFNYHFVSGYGEPFFAIVLGAIARITGSYNVFLFVVHAIIITGVYVGAYRHRQYVDPTAILLIFYLFFYNHSLNVFRQYIAMAIIFAFLADIQQKKYWRYIAAVFVATMFHTTAIMGIGALVLHFLLYYQNDKIKFGLNQRIPLIAGGLYIAVLFFNPIVELLIKIGILGERYAFFLKDDAISPSLVVMAIIVICLLAAYYFWPQCKKQCDHFVFYFMNSVVYLILMNLTYSVAYGKRVALYFAFADMITLGILAKAPENPKTKKIVQGAILSLALLYWVYIYVLRNASETVPYALGIW